MDEPATPPFGTVDHVDSRRVVATSTRRLPFEPRGAAVDFRNQLRDAIQGMDVDSGDTFHAVYSSPPGSGACDLENVLLYNVGMGTFAVAAADGLSLERRTGTRDHVMTYSLLHPTSRPPSIPGAVIADVSFSAPQRLGAADVWWAVRESLVGSPVARHAGEFAIELFVGRHVGRKGYLSALKPLLDGLIAALQSLPANVDDRDIAPRVAFSLGDLALTDRVMRHLTDPSSPLGEHRFVFPWGAGLQWSPSDDRLAALEVHVSPDASSEVRAIVRAV